MAHTCVMAYFIGLIVGSVGIFVFTDRPEETAMPVWPRAMICVAAGILWPVILLGVAELCLVAAFSPRRRHTSAPVIDTHRQYFTVRYDC